MSFSWLEGLFQDLRYGLRTLRKNPGFMIVTTVVALAGLLASWLPARKASASDPLDVIWAA